ncbi:MAG: hypothetical protein HC921_01295 [Synechococcaceae cyanobacterium SM2_3_1]|nr:hypothetical protein [Synechococcaceae cyanobacterium SM2_3_1]
MHESAREELLIFLEDKPALQAIQLTLHLDDYPRERQFTIELHSQELSEQLLETLNFRYRSPNDIVGWLWFKGGSWGKHHEGRWQFFESGAPPLPPTLAE